LGDCAFYADLARQAGGPVLELGCGTGRVLLPIAREGIPCVGLDRSPDMLEVLRAKGPPDNLALVHASMSDFSLGEARFHLVFAAFRGLQHLYSVDEQLAALACIRRHLAPGGRFAFDVSAPNPARMAKEEEPEQEDVRFLDGEAEVRRFAWIRRDHLAQVLAVRLRYERWEGDSKVSEGSSEIRLRWFHRFEIEHLLARAGFVVEAIYSGFDRRPFDATGDIIVVARAAP
jgi:SAM-dependent methyltransferase